MTGTIELDRDGRHLLIGFPYREDLVEEVRGLPQRRWDKGTKLWRVPIAHAELVVATFMKHGFEMTSDVMGVLSGTAGAPPAAEAKAKPGKGKGKKSETSADEDPKAGLRVSEVNERAKAALADAFPDTVRVIGEVVDFDKNSERDHIFFRLIEKAPRGRQIAASVDVALFERTAKSVLPKIEKQGLTMRDGIEIMIRARVDLYPKTGRYQLIIDDIEPEFTLGQLALSREQILAELREKGLDKLNAALPWPQPTLRIGVLTSPTSDGYNDFLRELESSGIGFDLTVFPVKVQGEELEPTVRAGLAYFAERAADFDVVCVLRGGGSRTDLAWFDNREVALAVAQLPIKVLCGIGHERDKSVLDEIAESRKTPTACAAFLVDSVREARDALAAQSRRLQDLAREALRLAHQDLAESAHHLSRAVHGRIVHERSRLEHAAARATTTTRHAIRSAREHLASAAERIVRGTARRFERENARLESWQTRQRLLDPRRVLARGYAIVHGADGAIAPSVSNLAKGDAIRIAFRDGAATAHVDSTTPDP